MTIQTVEAVYEHGQFRLVEPLPGVFQEGQRVRIVVETEAIPTMLALATGVFDGPSEQDIDEIGQIARDRDSFFGKPSPPYS